MWGRLQAADDSSNSNQRYTDHSTLVFHRLVTARVVVMNRRVSEPAGLSPVTCPQTRLPPALQREDSGQLREEGGLTAPHLHRNTRQLWQIVGKQLSPAPAFEFSTENKSAARLAGTSARRCLRGRSGRTWVADRSRSQGWRNLLDCALSGWQCSLAASVWGH